jgi:hypothetical protein
MRAILILLFLLRALAVQAQPSSQPAAKPRSAYWSAAGYVALNVGLLGGWHTLHAVREGGEEAEHAAYDAAFADVFTLGGLSLLGVGYVSRQKYLGEEIIAPRLFYRTAALSGAGAVLLYSLAKSLEDAEPEISTRAKFIGTLSLSFSLGSVTTALALRPRKE